MSAVHVVLIVLTIVANAGMAVADFLEADFVLANSAAVDVPRHWLPALGALKAAGAAGLLLGLLGVPVVGVAAATGLVAFFVGAIVVHVRARAFRTMTFPAAYLVLAVASLVIQTG
ncbi:DoxX family protein [Saccharothrix isguenensis]